MRVGGKKKSEYMKKQYTIKQGIYMKNENRLRQMNISQRIFHRTTSLRGFRVVLAAGMLLLPAAVGCFAQGSAAVNGNIPAGGEYVPAAPDYADSTMWYVERNACCGGADVFYIVSTWEEEWHTADGSLCRYADVWNAVHRSHMATEIEKVAKYMGEGNNFYAPYYRHVAIDTWMTRNEDTINRRIRLSMDDVRRAFDEFLRRRDSSRPLIVAGFSQGGRAVVELLKYMDGETYDKLVAAYVMGYKVTPADTAACKQIKGAKGEADTGVTVCYNTVKDVRHVIPVIADGCLAINPVNWRTDATPALLHDSITITLNPDRHVLVAGNYSGAEYLPYKDFINVGDIHSCEPWLYSDCLRRNFGVRTAAWRRQHGEMPCHCCR